MSGTEPAPHSGGYELSDDPARLDLDAVWGFLSTEACWGRWRTRVDVEAQVAGAWRVVGAYAADGAQVGFTRAVSDGAGFAYLADVFVAPEHRGHRLGHRLVETMVDHGPGADFRWVLVTRDAHGLYAAHGFGEPGEWAMVRQARGALGAPPA
ncbi:N-acetyltransferase [Luteimicrobium album]|uniref:N-acetyltransferase n=1 Tax=Luteimicrobium album TaxID=1054550 RepID=A0ABQ6I7K7_9MICO|nr:GNAT family N-acetyltransferase [Luteimicrobium album]GMA26133.1 N-acetyltransferase [Luteimicrobium album]